MEAGGGLAEGAAPGLKTATLLVLVGGLQSCSQVSSAALCWDENENEDEDEDEQSGLRRLAQGCFGCSVNEMRSARYETQVDERAANFCWDFCCILTFWF